MATDLWNRLSPSTQSALVGMHVDPNKFDESTITELGYTDKEAATAVVKELLGGVNNLPRTAQQRVSEFEKDAALLPNQGRPTADNPHGYQFTIANDLYEIDKNGIAQKVPGGVLNKAATPFTQQPQPDGSTILVRTSTDGKTLEYQGTSGPTQDKSQAIIIPAGETAKIESIGDFQLVTKTDKQGNKTYAASGGGFKTSSDPTKDPGVVKTLSPNAGVAGKETFNGKDYITKVDPTTHTTKWSLDNVNWFDKPQDAAGANANSSPTQDVGPTGSIPLQGSPEATPNQVAGAKLPYDLAKTKQDLRGATLTELDRIAEGMKSGTIPLNQGIVQMEQAVQNGAGNYLTAAQRASTIANDNSTAVNQANSRAATAGSMINNTMNWGDNQKGSNVSGKIQGMMLQGMPDMLKAYGAGPVDLKSTLGQMNVDPQSGLSNDFMATAKRYQPVTQDHIAKIKQYADMGMSYPEAVIKVAQENGIDTTGHGLGSMLDSSYTANNAGGSVM